MSIETNPIMDPALENESFRNSVGTMDDTGKRKWVFPRKPKGKYTNYRNYTSYLLLSLFFGLPFVTINNNPFLLINVIDRKFLLLDNLFTFRIFSF